MTDVEAHLKKFRKELHSGIAAMVLLALLERTGGEMYGYQIAKEIGAKAGGASFLKQGAIYPVLRSLHATGLLSSRVEVSMSGPPRRYYAISEALALGRGDIAAIVRNGIPVSLMTGIEKDRILADLDRALAES